MDFLNIILNQLWRLILLFLILLSSFGAGLAILKINSSYTKRIGQFNHFLLSITIGLGILSYSVFIVGLLNILNQLILWLIISIFLFLALYIIFKHKILNLNFNYFINPIRSLDGFSKFLLVIILLFVIVNYIGAIAPPLNIDDLKYHFAMPNRYLYHESIYFIEDIDFSNFPFPIEMLWTLAIGIDSGELAQILNWAMGLLVLCWIGFIGYKSDLSTPTIIVSIILFYSITIVGYQSRSGNVELASVLFFLSGFYTMVSYLKTQNYFPLILSGILFGIFTVVKISNAAMIILIILFIIFKVSYQEKSFKLGLKSGVVFSFFALIPSAAWYLKTYYMTGNPVYPFLQSYFGGPQMRIDLLAWNGIDMVVPDTSLANLVKTPTRLFSQFWYILSDPQKLRGHISPLFISMLPIIIYNYNKYNKIIKMSIVISFLFYFYWIAFYPLLRIGLPLFALITISTSLAMNKLMDLGLLHKIVVRSLLILFLTISFMGQLREVIPSLPVIIGSQSKENYFNDFGNKRYQFDSFSAVNFMNNNLPDNSKILLWSNSGYYLKRDYLYVLGFITSMAYPKNIYNHKMIIKEMKKFGITHVAMTDNFLRKKLKDTLLETNKLDILYKDKAMIVASLPD